MKPNATISEEIRTLAKALEDFEAEGKQEGATSGSRSDGYEFEFLLGEFWAAIAKQGIALGGTRSAVPSKGKKNYVLLENNKRQLVLPAHLDSMDGGIEHVVTRWLDVEYYVEELVESFPGMSTAIKSYAPSEGKYAGVAYSGMYSGMKTEFDDTILLVDNGVLTEKILLEYKTAKSTAGLRIDGNAHERLSFQIMQYLEVATRYTKCSLVVISNGAFARYRNKYHVNFHVQADRLKNFSWFEMSHASETYEYLALAERLLNFIKD